MLDRSDNQVIFLSEALTCLSSEQQAAHNVFARLAELAQAKLRSARPSAPLFLPPASRHLSHARRRLGGLGGNPNLSRFPFSYSPSRVPLNDADCRLRSRVSSSCTSAQSCQPKGPRSGPWFIAGLTLWPHFNRPAGLAAARPRHHADAPTDREPSPSSAPTDDLEKKLSR